MFNLLMQYAPWGTGRDTVAVGRVFEYTNDEIVASFKEGEKVLLDKLIRHPCLFMREGTDDELAYVGMITRARIVGKEIAIEYAHDLDIPPLLNNTIYANKTDFDMPHDFEFSRGHWAVKDVDIYRVLPRNHMPRRQRPTVFELAEHERIEPALISAMMPFDGAFRAVYESLKATAEKVAFAADVPTISGKIRRSFRTSYRL